MTDPIPILLLTWVQLSVTIGIGQCECIINSLCSDVPILNKKDLALTLRGIPTTALRPKTSPSRGGPFFLPGPSISPSFLVLLEEGYSHPVWGGGGMGYCHRGEGQGQLVPGTPSPKQNHRQLCKLYLPSDYVRSR